MQGMLWAGDEDMDYFTSFFAAISLRRLLKNRFGRGDDGAPVEKTDKDREDFPP